MLQQAAHVGDQVAQVEALDAFDVLARVGEELFHDLASANGGFRCGGQQAAGLGRVAGIQMLEREAQVAADRGEQVVDVVRDSAGEASEGLHALGAMQGVLQVALLGQVAPEDDGSRMAGQGERADSRMRRAGPGDFPDLGRAVIAARS